MEKEREGNDMLFNRHHLIPKSKSWLSNEHNVVKIDERKHRIWHTWCGNDTPIEAICRVLLWNEKVWSENFKADLIAVLDNYLNKYYEKKTHKWMIRSETERVLELQNL
jgi:hypothetical protein